MTQECLEPAFTFLDVETTGLNPQKGDRICEIAIIKQQADQEIIVYEKMINPGRSISLGASMVNGITNEMVSNSPRFAEIAAEIKNIISDSIIIAHNIPFDLSFLNTEFSILNIPNVKNKFIDTLILSRRHYKLPKNNLADVARYFQIPMNGNHRAMLDVRIMQKLFFRLMTDLKERKIIDSFQDLIGN